MKKIIILIILGLSIWIFSWCEQKISNENEKILTEEKKFLPKVKILEIWENTKKNFTILWEVFPEKESVFASKVPDWIISKIYVKNWDKVKKWQVLMEIKSAKTLQNYLNAKNNYQKAVAVWNQSIKSASVNLNNLKSLSEKQKNELTESLSSSKSSINLAIQKAEADLQSIILLNQKMEKTARENLENAMKSAVILSEKTLNDIDKILWIEDRNEENAMKYQSYLWNLNTESLYNARDNYRLAKKFFDENKNSTDLEKILELLKKVKISSDSNLKLLKNSTTGSNFTNTELQNLINSFSASSSTIQSSLNSLVSLTNALNTTIESNQKNKTTAENALKIVKNAGENWNSKTILTAESSYEKNIKSLDNSIQSTEENLKSVQKSVQQNISAALANLKNAEIAMQDLIIKADFSGEVSDIFVDKWDNVWLWTKLVSVSNNSQFKIVAFLSKYQISWISKWDLVKIWKKSHDKIFSISSNSDPITKKYKVEILHENPFLSAWQFIELTFTRNLDLIWSDKIFLDLPAVFVTDKEDYVWLVDSENKIKKQKVELGGIFWNKIEIVNGLKKWDFVIIWGGRFLKKEWEVVEVVE